MKTKTIRKRKSTPAKKRSYNNATRKLKSLEAQKVIIETLVELLVERKGGEVRIDEISKKAGISERTIFRFFKDKNELQEATNNYLASFLQASVIQIDTHDVLGFARNVYSLFEQNENLVMAYLYSSFGQQARLLFRKKLNELIIARILADRKLEATPERMAHLAVIASLINAKLWQDIKTDFGFEGDVIGKAISEAMRVLIENLK